MPAIPVYARLEMHLTDEELHALTVLAQHLVKDHAPAPGSVPEAPAGDTSSTRLNVACRLYAAALRTMRERNLSA